ncbi:substrate-binding periplasmic protein [Bdellovibrio reynosensis]|uniref:Transporter substrate-binding domain-containing protein n=1 Tax=Bdellovibrio reynosensis TaxID=2835041 RepID=A0ABY4C904_9BACT|nr:transporter substrate-binding domain-containing protein [Bdellovibrio reynosensis]UOF01407.1 transporter substrate-binding domain-containing protein [Bdellovibrio reynosensis]
MTVIGYDFNPFYYNSGSEGIQGACFDFLSTICKSQNENCKFKIASQNQVVSMVVNGEVDLMCPVAKTPYRETVLEFTESIFESRYSFFTLEENLSRYHDYKDIKGQTVGVMNRSASHESLIKFQDRTPFKIVAEEKADAVLRKADSKIYSLVYMNRDVAMTWIKKNRSTLKEIPTMGEDISYFIAFSKKRTHALRTKNFADEIRKLKRTKFLSELSAKYQLQPANHLHMN